MAFQRVPTLVQLAKRILTNAKSLEASVAASPTFQNDTMQRLPEPVDSVRKEIIDGTNLLNSLVRGGAGPFGRIQHTTSFTYLNELSLQAVYRYRIPQNVPVDQSISFTDLSKKVGVEESKLVRLLRHAMTYHMFYEPKKGSIAHTVDSRALLDDPTLYDFVGTCIEDLRPASSKVLDAFKKWPQSEEMNHCGFSLAWDTDKPMYAYLRDHPERMRRFAGLMARTTQPSSIRAATLVGSAYPWQDLKSGTVVDIGGGNGHISVAIGESHPHLDFIIQDLQQMPKEVQEKAVPQALKSKVQYQQHNFFAPQPVKGAVAYMLMQILHNWSDKYCVQILQQLIPALEPGARIIVIDRVIPERGEVPDVEYHEVLTLDLIMMQLFNARERSLEDTKKMFALADPRFKWVGAYRVGPGPYTMLEAIWAPDEVHDTPTN
ncbi:S-adenosyl-L-methionine-dependent methyltransferase [Eremomyces bilateralis CBS 781.70]|uniref:S-adenosyl-L-methionine-dependent methyltransferase n=1 Tax=Eremomyces bilateralis CBS 781.70 TaxID=1392243 RepID=A0A6G1GA48_9PEZI|nr:S-adenosyl-L-methionine-dependent methyltransferase [Eremomyces bilateralis CBS 781.70]KAF1814913.1 S-adenosyl-L-methionine-dependent methyltransferase [Eremomyces bilateralis CBS 781.70]